MPLPSRLSFAIANSVAALTALWIAFALDLQRPYWSTFAVFVVAKPLSGAVRSKAVFRLMGTLLGAGVALLLVPPLVQAPPLLCVAIACWVGFCVYVSSLDRTPRSYALVLAGYTAAIVGFSAVNTPLSIFDIAVARVEENSIGIVCAALAHSIFFPHNATEEVSGVLRTATDRAAGWIGTALRGMDPAVEEMAAPRAAQVLDQLHAATTFIVYETSNVRRSGLLLATLQDRLALVPTHVSAIHQAARAHTALSPLPLRIIAALDQAAAMVLQLRQAGSREELPTTALRMAARADAPDPSTRAAEYEQAIFWHLDELLASCRDFCLLTLALKERAPLSADELARHGIPQRHELPGVGRNLQDHLDYTVLVQDSSRRGFGLALSFIPRAIAGLLAYLFRRRGFFTSNAAEAGGFARLGSQSERPEVQFHFLPAYLKDHGRKLKWGYGCTLHVCQLRPKSRGHISLRSADPLDDPRICANYLEHPDDLREMIAAVRLARRVLQAPAFNGINGGEVEPGPTVQSDDEIAADLRRRAETIYHPVGTCKMGADAMAVVDSNLRVRGIDGLRVADASIMPTLIGGNTNAPAMVIAERAARMILAQSLAAPGAERVDVAA